MDGKPKSDYLSSVRIKDGKSHTIVGAVRSVMEKFGLDMRCAVGLGTDGAAAMTGRKMGAGVQIKSKYSPFITQIHCAAHRLALACSDSVKKIESLETFKSRFNTLYFHFSSSGTRSTELQAVQEVFDDPVLKMKEPHHIRWLSLRNAVAAVFKTYPSVVSSLAELGISNPVAKSLHSYFKTERTAVLCAFMFDVHEVLASFSCVLQKEDIIFSELMPQLDMTLAALDRFKTNDGQYLAKMKSDLGEHKSLKGVNLTGLNRKETNDLSKIISKYLDSLQDNLKGRLASSDGDVVSNFGSILEPLIFDDELADIAIEDLASFYGVDKDTQIIDEEGTEHNSVQYALLDKRATLEEWPKFKALIKGSYKRLKTKDLCCRIILLHEQSLPNIAKLCKIALCLCITSVECERAFSTQNRLKTKFRCSLKPDNLDNIMTICLRGPQLRSYDPTPAIRIWRNRKKRRLARLKQPYRPRKHKK